jgi:predicted trehalose synthase
MAISSDLEHLLVRWLPRQRWMPGLGVPAGAEPDITPQSVVRIAEVADPHAGTVQCLLVVLAVRGPARRTRLCVPLTVRTVEDHALRPHLIGTVDDLLLGRTFVYDGAADPVFVLALADAIRDSRSSAVEGFVTQRAGDELPAVPPRTAAPEAAADSGAGGTSDETTVSGDDGSGLVARAAQHSFRSEEGLTGESRVEIEGPDGDVALTVLREVGAENPPAVRYPLALTARDSTTIHPVIGWARTRWYDDADLATVTSPFAVLAHALPNGRRAWRSAVEKALDVDSGSVGSFSRQASVLGSTAGRLHMELAGEFGTVRSEGDPTTRLVTKWRDRIDWALRSAPAALAPHEERLRAHGESLADLDSIGLLQRIHGELTLDHVTVGTAEGPRIIGFGVGRDEPRPVELDLVALVRSTAYAAGFAWLQRHADSDTAQDGLRALATNGLERQLREDFLESPEHLWFRRTINSLLSGYSHARGTTTALTDPLLRAALIDRLLVETVTELRNRPAWLILPLAALAEILGEDQVEDQPTEAPEEHADSLQVDPDVQDDTRIVPGADVLPRDAGFVDDHVRPDPGLLAASLVAADGEGTDTAEAEAETEVAAEAEADAAEAEDAGAAAEAVAADDVENDPEDESEETAEAGETAELDGDTEAEELAESEGAAAAEDVFDAATGEDPETEETRDGAVDAADDEATEAAESHDEPAEEAPAPVPADPAIPPRPMRSPGLGPEDAGDLDEDGAGIEETVIDVTPRSARDSR